jgi:hypothetical protein
MRKLVFIALTIIVFTACKDREREVTMTQPINLNGNISTNQVNAGKVNPQFTAANSSAMRLNPAHGQPGHRCDISVGAPLPDPTAVNAVAIPPATTTQTATTQTATPVSIPGNTVNTSGKLNPAHGQPGHRCDIAVGAPLNSPPGKTVTTTQARASAPQVTPVAPGMNPQHGQPGHRCDIAVGAPLNSPAPKTETPVQAEPVKDSSGIN